MSWVLFGHCNNKCCINEPIPDIHFPSVSTHVLLCPTGLDKITEKSQVSEDGTMVTVPHSDAAQAADSSAIAGASDTESNSERDREVHQDSDH